MTRFRSALWILASVTGVVLLLSACHLIGVAHAQAVANPVVTAVGSTDAAWQLLIDYGPIMGGILVVYGVGRAFLARNESKHWIAQGKTLSIATGAATVIGAVLEWKLNGGSPAGILVAIYAAINLATHSTVSMTKVVPAAPSAPPPSIAPVAMLVVMLLGVATLQPGCASWRARGAAGVGAFLDCESEHIDATMLADATSLAKEAIKGAISGDGHADAAKLRADAEPLKSDLLRCAFAGGIAALATPAPAQPGAPAAAGLEVDGAELRGAFAATRADLGWPAVKVAKGPVL